ncbi:site-specific integrase [Rubrivirga sp.]|uniref:site-specific integrase n=1 Tax=Rubrivirga sp. TaxID=1885344 RepID=UPI003C769636
MASVRLTLQTRKIRRDGTAPVWLRVTVNRKSRYTSTGVAVEPKYWNNDKQLVRRSHPLADAFNAKLADLVIVATQATLEGGTAQAVKEQLGGGTGSLSAFFRRHIDDLEARGAFWQWKKYRTTLGKLEAALGPEGKTTDVQFKDLDRHALVRFERHLRKACGNAPNTIRKEMQRLRRVVRGAVRADLLKPGDDPFLLYDQPKGERPDRLKLSIDDVLAIAAVLEVDGVPIEDGSALAIARDAFAFSFYGGGVRFSDVATLRPEHVRTVDGVPRLEYRMLKTGTLVDLPLPPPAVAIAERYADGGAFLFPMLEAADDDDPVRLRRRISSWNTRVNAALKTLATAAEIDQAERVSFHASRHAYAVFAASKSGDLFAISKALGHTSLQVTQQYLRSFDRDATDRLSEQLWT